MNTNVTPRLVLWAAICMAIFPTALRAAERKVAQPNIVFILLDNVGREWFGCYGSEEQCTPNYDRLARAGVRFENCYTTVVCGPSRVELLTGRYPHRTGWYLHHDAALYSGGGFDPRREVSIARVLRDNGYATGIAGKWQVNNLYDEPDVLTQHGFQEQLVWPGSIDRERVDDTFWKSYQEAIVRRDAPFLTEATRKIESRYWDPVLLRNGRRERAEGRFGPDMFAEFAVDFVRRHREGPFFLYYPMVLTHGQNASEPVVATPANRAAPPQEEKAKFADMVRYADKQIGEFFDELDKLGLRDNTIVFVASDNGTEKSISARANGRTVQGGLYQINEPGGNVPIMVNCPARIAGGRTAPLTDFTDVFPTICDLTHCPRPKDVKLDGQSFASFLQGEGKAPREWIFNEYGPDRVVRDERFKLNQRGELFDLAADPDEQHPLAALDAASTAAKAKLQPVLDGMPAQTPLPFEHRSLSAFKLRAAAAKNGDASPGPVNAKAADPVKTTVTYKQAAGVDIKADVYAVAGATEPRPAVVWIHGGGLIMGHREQLSSQVRDFARANGFVLVSLDYRLAPETKLPAILSDIEDAFKWMRSDAAKQQFHIDPQRIAVTGGSAGGFLTLASGYRVEPAPRVLLAFWGYGELLSDWACGPSPYPRHNQKKISDEEAARQTDGSPVADSRERKGDGGAIYLHGRQTGEWARAVSGLDPKREPEKFTPLLPLKNVTARYPPTVLVHGTADTDVPFEQSQLMVAEFKKHGIPFELHAVEGGEHGLGGGKPDEIAEAYRKAFEFVKRELLKP